MAKKETQKPIDAQLRACERQLSASQTTIDRLDVLEQRFELLVDMVVPLGAWRANVSPKEAIKKLAWRRMSPEEQRAWGKEATAADERRYGRPSWAK